VHARASRISAPLDCHQPVPTLGGTAVIPPRSFIYITQLPDSSRNNLPASEERQRRALKLVQPCKISLSFVTARRRQRVETTHTRGSFGTYTLSLLTHTQCAHDVAVHKRSGVGSWPHVRVAVSRLATHWWRCRFRPSTHEKDKHTPQRWSSRPHAMQRRWVRRCRASSCHGCRDLFAYACEPAIT
jgi:hypothetical protein